MLLSYIIDTQEERGVVVIDIPNAFIQILIDHEKYMAIIKIRRILVDTLIDIVPDVSDHTYLQTVSESNN